MSVLRKTLETSIRWGDRADPTPMEFPVSLVPWCHYQIWEAEPLWWVSHPTLKCSPELVWDDSMLVQCILPQLAKVKLGLGEGGGGAVNWGFSFPFEGWGMYSSWSCYWLEFPGEVGRESGEARTLPDVRISFDELSCGGRSSHVLFLGDVGGAPHESSSALIMEIPLWCTLLWRQALEHHRFVIRCPGNLTLVTSISLWWN